MKTPKELREYLEKRGKVKEVLEKIVKLVPGVKWEEVKETKADAASVFHVSGTLGEGIGIECMVATESMETEQDWFILYRTSVHIAGVGGYVQVSKNGVYSQTVKVDRAIILSYSTSDIDPPPQSLEMVKVGDERRLPGEDKPEILESYFFSPEFQDEILGFLTRMTLLFIPRDVSEESMKQITSMTSGSEVMHYQVKKAEGDDTTGTVQERE